MYPKMVVKLVVQIDKVMSKLLSRDLKTVLGCKLRTSCVYLDYPT